MPERSFEALTKENREQAVRYEPGYDWIPGRFGPPPGIPRAKKEQFVMKLSQEERESLMISEAERRRTFTVHWPIPSVVDGNDLAKEGFYYTGVSDRVQCAFCAGIIRNWERGDIPKVSHKNFFNYCKMVQKRPCHNIPYDSSGLPKELTSQQLTTNMSDEQFGNGPSMRDLGINDNKPKYHMYSVGVKRMETYTRYSSANPLPADVLCAAGFFYEGPGDKVRCFWCDGALELWSQGDDPMLEHAKWYPGCSYVRQAKGVEYIRKARSQMSAEDMATADSLSYNKADTTFLDDKPVQCADVSEYETYKVCVKLGFHSNILKSAFKYNNDEEYENIQMLIEVMAAIKSAHSADSSLYESGYESDSDSSDYQEIRLTAEQKLEEETAVEKVFSQWKRRIQCTDIMDTENLDLHDETSEIVDVEEFIKRPDTPTEEESFKLVKAMTCHVCQNNIVGAVLLPCGHFCLCQTCSRKNLPAKCPYCRGAVKGACRAYLN